MGPKKLQLPWCKMHLAPQIAKGLVVIKVDKDSLPKARKWMTEAIESSKRLGNIVECIGFTSEKDFYLYVKGMLIQHSVGYMYLNQESSFEQSIRFTVSCPKTKVYELDVTDNGYVVRDRRIQEDSLRHAIYQHRAPLSVILHAVTAFYEKRLLREQELKRPVNHVLLNVNTKTEDVDITLLLSDERPLFATTRKDVPASLLDGKEWIEMSVMTAFLTHLNELPLAYDTFEYHGNDGIEELVDDEEEDYYE